MATAQSYTTQQSHPPGLNKSNWLDYLLLLRPFTLLYPFVGLCCAALCAQNGILDGSQWCRMLLCGLGVSLLNAASNVLNQIADLDIDKINKGHRPLCKGTISLKHAKVFTIILYVVAYCIFIGVQLLGGRFSIMIAVVVGFLTFIYSYGPRTKQYWLASGLTISLCRGLLLTLIGWFCVQSSFSLEPFLLGSIWTLFIFGAAATKDFADMEGDAAYDCQTLPVQYGLQKAALFIAPFLIFPFILFNIFANYSLLQAQESLLHLLGLFLSCWGIYIAFLIQQSAHSFSNSENHSSWKHMYLLMMFGQAVQTIAYCYY